MEKCLKWHEKGQVLFSYWSRLCWHVGQTRFWLTFDNFCNLNFWLFIFFAIRMKKSRWFHAARTLVWSGWGRQFEFIARWSKSIHTRGRPLCFGFFTRSSAFERILRWAFDLVGICSINLAPALLLFVGLCLNRFDVAEFKFVSARTSTSLRMVRTLA